MYREFSFFYLNKCIWSFWLEFWYMFPSSTFTIQRLVSPGAEILNSTQELFKCIYKYNEEAKTHHQPYLRPDI